MRRQTIALILGLLLLPCAAAAQGRKAQLAQLSGKIDDLRQRIDKELLHLFDEQVQAAVYRSRIANLQKQWGELFAAFGGRPDLPTPPPAPPSAFRIREVAASDAHNLAQAVVTPSCKTRKGCTLWARISFGNNLVRAKTSFEVAVDLQKSGSTSKYAIPAKTLTATKSLMVVQLPLSAVRIFKGGYTGKIKVMCGGRYRSKPFEFELLKTY